MRIPKIAHISICLDGELVGESNLSVLMSGLSSPEDSCFGSGGYRYIDFYSSGDHGYSFWREPDHAWEMM